MSEQKLTKDGIPLIEPKEPYRKVAPDGAIAQCGVCGLRLMPVMGYSCSRQNCPCFYVVSC